MRESKGGSGFRRVPGETVAGEGTALDSTYGRNNSVAQGLSYNFLYATNLSNNSDRRFDLGVIAGLREKSSDCPDSYLGYQCYADESPDVEYGFNFGAMLHVTFQTFKLIINSSFPLNLFTKSFYLLLKAHHFFIICSFR